MLTVGDYLSSIGSNYSFLTDPQRNPDSWKRFLRGASGKREHLKALWDSIDANTDIEPQLEQLITSAASLQPWRSAIIKYPEVISYCGQQEIRREANSDKMYLLKKRQMNGTHAELFSYALHLELAGAGVPDKLAPLRLQSYQSVTMTELEPHVLLAFDRAGRRVNVAIESAKGQFRVYTRRDGLKELPEVEVVLCDAAEFVEEDGDWALLVPRGEIHHVLEKVAQSLATLPR